MTEVHLTLGPGLVQLRHSTAGLMTNTHDTPEDTQVYAE